MLLRLFILCSIFLGAQHVHAHVPVFVSPETVDDLTLIEDPMLSQAFYGEMSGFPHTFLIRVTEPIILSTQILLPDIETSKNNVSGLIVKEPEKRGRVTEITRMESKDSSWESSYEMFSGDSYRHGPLDERELEKGVYRLEVHTPDNIEKYVLVVGKREEMTIGYVEIIRRLAEVKVFFEKSKFRVIESPYVYIPVGVLVIISFGVGMYIRKRKQSIMIPS
jgi:hypothetical protein